MNLSFYWCNESISKYEWNAKNNFLSDMMQESVIIILFREKEERRQGMKGNIKFNRMREKLETVEELNILGYLQRSRDRRHHRKIQIRLVHPLVNHSG